MNPCPVGVEVDVESRSSVAAGKELFMMEHAVGMAEVAEQVLQDWQNKVARSSVIMLAVGSIAVYVVTEKEKMHFIQN